MLFSLSASGTAIAYFLPALIGTKRDEKRLKNTTMVMAFLYFLLGGSLFTSSFWIEEDEAEVAASASRNLEEITATKTQKTFILLLAISSCFNTITDTITTARLAEVSNQVWRGIFLAIQ